MAQSGVCSPPLVTPSPLQDTVDMFTGVRISVSFGVGGKTVQMERLSGGQKSLVPAPAPRHGLEFSVHGKRGV